MCRCSARTSRGCAEAANLHSSQSRLSRRAATLHACVDRNAYTPASLVFESFAKREAHAQAVADGRRRRGRRRRHRFRGGVAGARAPAIDGKKGKPAEVALEFTAQEVVRPLSVALPLRIEFSGPLVAPRTAVVRAKAAGTLRRAERRRRQPRARRAAARRDRPVGPAGARHRPRRGGRVGAGRTRRGRAPARRERRAVAAELHLADGAAVLAGQARCGERAAQVGPGPARDGAHRHPRGQPDGADLGRRQQAQRGAGREAQRRAGRCSPSSTSASSNSPAPSARTRCRASRPACAVEVRVEGVAEPVAGRLARIAPAAEPGTRSIGVTVAVPNPRRDLPRRPVRPGPGRAARQHAAPDACRRSPCATPRGRTRSG